MDVLEGGGGGGGGGGNRLPSLQAVEFPQVQTSNYYHVYSH